METSRREHTPHVPTRLRAGRTRQSGPGTPHALDWLNRSTPAVVVKFEPLDPDGSMMLVRIGEDDELLVWVP